jgi:hypothetical protein
LEGKLAVRQKELELSLSSFLRGPLVRKARRAAKKAWELAKQNRKMVSGKLSELKDWAEWSDKRVIEWWKGQKRRERSESQAEQRRQRQQRQLDVAQQQQTLYNFWKKPPVSSN